MVSLNDVAKTAHVSKMTVSRVLNHPELVSLEIQEDVQQAILELGYVQNRAGRALANKRHYNIAFVLLDDIAEIEPYYAHLLIHLTDALRHHGYTLEVRHDREFDLTNVDAFLVSGARRSDIEALHLPVPLVIYGMEPGLISVDSDNAVGTAMATEYLINHGFEHVMYLGLAINEPFALNRETGYRQTMLKYGLPIEAYELPNNECAATELITLINPAPGTGIVTATDRLALGAIRASQALGLSFPNEIGIIGFDGIYIHKLSSPTLTTIQQPLGVIANTMVKLLMAQLNGETVASELITPTLVIGNSTP